MGRGARTVALTAALFGCGAGASTGTVRDVSGAEFGWSCDQGCKVTRVADTPPPDACPNPNDAAYSFTWGRFVEICSVCLEHADGVYWSSSAGQCRPIGCSVDLDCPTVIETPVSTYECVNGVCENTDTTTYPRDQLSRDDVLLLCFADHPRAETTNDLSPASEDVETAVDAACPATDPTSACSLPVGCHAP
jgi:hypothetical protein